MTGIYNHRCSVMRVTEVTNEWGETQTKWETIHPVVPCHLSVKTLRPSETSPITSSRNDYKLFMPIQYQMQQSDRIIIGDRIFTANNPTVYKLLQKQEIMLSEVSE